tara:strand:- start:68 stop:796 length:729 start_codon:yes stop_codon:yes gene_type:complete
MSTVYYSGYAAEMDNFTVIDPEPLLKSVTKEWKGKDAFFLLKCPAMTNEMKNTFVIRAPFDITVSWDDEKGFHFTNKAFKNLGQGGFDNFFKLVPNEKSDLMLTINQIFTGYGNYLFFADEPTTLQLQPANYHKTKISKFPFIAGSYEIDKWCRPIILAIINDKKEDIVIKRNDPLYYVKFYSKKDVVLKRFEITREIEQIVVGSLTIKKYLQGYSMRRLYDMFMQSGNKKRILKAIRQQHE